MNILAITTEPTKRDFLKKICALGFFMCICRQPLARTRLTLGAIRWDAWYDSEGEVGRAVEKSLGPEEFHSRIPFFGREVDRDHVAINGNTQATIDAEIKYATAMGLDYWAYCWYESGSSFRRAWNLHQTSGRRNEMKWCMLWQLSHLGGPGGFSSAIADFVTWFAQPNYQKLESGAPLVYFYLDSDDVLTTQWRGGPALINEALDHLAAACIRNGLGKPYVVIMNGDPDKASSFMKSVGGAAISNYLGWIPKGKPAPFSRLIEFNKIFWNRMVSTRAPIVPIVMTGWDKRPRQWNPVPWERGLFKKGSPLLGEYVTPGANKAIDAAIHEAVLYVASFPKACPSNTVLIYSWNECDEGGGALVSKDYLADEHHLH